MTFVFYIVRSPQVVFFLLKYHLVLKILFSFVVFCSYFSNNSVQLKKYKAEDTSVVVGALLWVVLSGYDLSSLEVASCFFSALLG